MWGSSFDDAIDATGAAQDTVVVFTSDHGDQCGSHALRSKGPWNYEETMHIPLYVAAPGLGKTTVLEAVRIYADLAGDSQRGAHQPRGSDRHRCRTRRR